MTTAINWSVTKEDSDLIDKVVHRAEAIMVNTDRTELWMDITAAHANGCALDLPRLLEADDYNFVHDVAGIRRHIDRRTGQIEGGFLPRCAARS